MKPAFTDVLGNLALRNRLGDDIQNGRISHAYIIEGAYGTGKHMLALRIAAALACENKDSPATPLPCMGCLSCRKILGGNSPDVIFINRGDKATLGVEAIRNLKQDVCVAPNDVSVKIYIIEDAHLMTVQAQNAFLLTLEEPPPYVLFLLLCESVTPLLETIRSRAPTLRTEPIPAEEIGKHLCRVNTDAAGLAKASPKDFSEILAAADGSIGKALNLLDAKARKPIIARRETAREFVRLCSSRRNSSAALRFLNSLGQKREELTEQLSIILLCLRDLLLCKQTEQAPLCFFSDREEASALSYGFTTPALLELCDRVCDAISRLRVNANVRLTLTELAVQTSLL
ncbi:MAG: DNA polymerase III subunit [Clostridia bacterium]|nr:DNA polymerase III subunit [Clostridia bacterium]MBQ7348250.1 DNA polymerase III subunit [Clostridia bacterium]